MVEHFYVKFGDSSCIFLGFRLEEQINGREKSTPHDCCRYAWVTRRAFSRAHTSPTDLDLDLPSVGEVITMPRRGCQSDIHSSDWTLL